MARTCIMSHMRDRGNSAGHHDRRMFDFTARTQKEMTQRVQHILGLISAFKNMFCKLLCPTPSGCRKETTCEAVCFLVVSFPRVIGPLVPLRNLSGTGESAGWPTPSRPTLPIPPLWVLAPLGLFQIPLLYLLGICPIRFVFW